MRSVRKKKPTIHQHKTRHVHAEQHDDTPGVVVAGHHKTKTHRKFKTKHTNAHERAKTKHHGRSTHHMKHQFKHTLGHFFWLGLVVVGFTAGGYFITTTIFAEDAGGQSAVVETDQQLLEKYPGLPVAVARTVNSVVATQRITDAADNQGEVASGVIVDDDQVLTAAHTVRADNGTVTCTNMTVAATGLLTGATASRDPVKFASSNKYGTADLAILAVDGGANFRSLPKATLAKSAPEVGETVYFINFEPTVDGKIRAPTSQASGDPNTDYSKPAIFSGTIASVGKDDIVVATGAGVSYGLGVKDVVVRKGASGGAVINNKGRLVGVSVSSDSLETDATAASIAKEYGQKLPDHQYQIAHIEPVSEKILASLGTSLTSCD